MNQQDEIVIKSKSPWLFKKKGSELFKTEDQRFSNPQSFKSNNKISSTWRKSTIAKSNLNLSSIPALLKQTPQTNVSDIQSLYNSGEDLNKIKLLQSDIELKKNKIKDSVKNTSDLLKTINSLNVTLTKSKENLENLSREIMDFEKENEQLREEIKELKAKKAERERKKAEQQNSSNNESQPPRRTTVSREVFENYILSLLMNLRAGGNNEEGEAYPNVDNMTYEELLELEERIGNVSKGISKEKINKIQKDIYNPVKYKESNKCIVCQFEYNKGESVKVLPCKHYYHPECIDQWWENQNVCPSCKVEVKIE